MADIDRRLEAIDEESLDRESGDDANAKEPMINHMIRLPTEEDFDDVLSVEGDMSHDIIGTGVSQGTGISNDSLGPNG